MTDEYQRAFYIFVIACTAIPVVLAIAVGAFALGDRTTRKSIARKTKLDLLPAPIRRLAYAAGALALFLWTSLVAVAVCGLILTLVVTLFRLFPDTTPLGRFFPDTGNWRLELFLIAALTGTLGAMIAFPFTIARVLFTRRQTVAQEEDLLTKRINEAVEGLGAEKEVSRHLTTDKGTKLYHEREGAPEELDFKRPVIVQTTEPNLEVRTGAILALERLAQKNLSVHVQIMQILCAYIRENATSGQDRTTFNFLESPNDLPEAERTAVGKPLLLSQRWDQVRRKNERHVSTRTDIRTALEVLSRRTRDSGQIVQEASWGTGDGSWPFAHAFPAFSDSEDPARYRVIMEQKRSVLGRYGGFRADLRGANFRFSDLSELDLRGANLEGAQLQGADISGTQMQGAVLSDAQMQWADLSWAQMQGTDVLEAKMQGAELLEAQMQGAFLVEVGMQGTDLMEAQLEGAVIMEAQMQGADLRRAHLQAAELSDVHMQGVNLSGAQMQGAKFLEVEMDETTDLGAANLRGATLRSMDQRSLEKLRPFWPDVFSDMSPSDDTARPPHWPTQSPDHFNTAWHVWQRSLPKDWQVNWPEDGGEPEKDWSDAYRDFRARWDAATRGKAPPEKG